MCLKNINPVSRTETQSKTGTKVAIFKRMIFLKMINQ
ncbi:hypothetical protein SMB34_10700 [Thalassospira permensis NBRC 106175]|uniref:Transposase n=1 Tax=Thalassospira permensis NBRC 106175 TaxID=1353532 RepID=A0ABR4THU6_9PROT|nr:hypothetical protein SMB34_10700 [Thalassospira permensis NBRC 106175]